MQILVDTSALIAVVANEPTKGRLIEMSRGFELIAPASVHWEIGNAISAGLKRGRFDPEAANLAIQTYNRIRIRFVQVSLADAVRLAHQLNLYAYDAYIVACAQLEGCSVLTLDQSLAHAARRVGVHVPEVAQ